MPMLTVESKDSGKVVNFWLPALARASALAAELGKVDRGKGFIASVNRTVSKSKYDADISGGKISRTWATKIAAIE